MSKHHPIALLNSWQLPSIIQCHLKCQSTVRLAQSSFSEHLSLLRTTSILNLILPPMMVNIMCQLDQDSEMSRYLARHDSRCVCESSSREAFELVDWAKQMTLPSVSGPHPIHWGPEWNKRQRKEEFTPSLDTWALVSPHTWTKTYMIGDPGTQAFELPLKLYRQFPRSPACRWQIRSLFSFCNHMSQFLIINLCLCVCVCLIGFMFWRNLTHSIPPLPYLWR